MTKVRLGIDVGGTNTDAVLLCNDEVVGSAKCATSNNILSGIRAAVIAALQHSKLGALQPACARNLELKSHWNDLHLCRFKLCSSVYDRHDTLRQCLRTKARAY